MEGDGQGLAFHVDGNINPVHRTNCNILWLSQQSSAILFKHVVMEFNKKEGSVPFLQSEGEDGCM